jgi:hypothetical protein
MRKQLRDQQVELNQLTVDTWVARIDTYKSKLLAKFTELDKDARAAVAVEIRGKLDVAKADAESESIAIANAIEELASFEKWLASVKIDPLKMPPKLRKRHGWLKFSVKVAQNIGPAREKLRAFLARHGDLSKLDAEQEKEFVNLSNAARMVGRSGEERIFNSIHKDEIDLLAQEKSDKNKWGAWGAKGKSLHALLHNPDQVAGGHGAIDPTSTVKKPVRPAESASDAEWAKYNAEHDAYKAALSKFVGNSWVNSIIGSGWGNKIPGLKAEITSAENYNPPVYALWMLNLKLDHAFAKK